MTDLAAALDVTPSTAGRMCDRLLRKGLLRRHRARAARRAVQVLDEALALLEEVKRDSIWDAIGQGAFADVKRTRTGGKGYAGVVERDREYLNPILDALEGENGSL